MEDLYDVLGVARSAGEEEIRSAFKRKAMDAHPDRGGSKQSFQALVRARDILMDSQRRQAYDRTGTDPGLDNARNSIREDAAKLLRHIVERAIEVSTIDVVVQAKELLRQSRANVQAERNKVARFIEKSEETVKRISVKGENPESNFVLMMLSEEIEKDRSKLDSIDEKLAAHEDIERILDGFEYASDSAGRTTLTTMVWGT